jgi:hypothetical protein
MGIFNQLAEYLFLKKPDPNRPKSSWVKYMHGINRISILMFLFGMVLLLLKLFVFKKS